MAVYNSKGTGSISSSAYSLLLGEQHLYGSSRLGILNLNISVKKVDDNTGVFSFTRGNKFFELSNHLGNVLATISDKKVPVDDGTYAHNSSTGLLEKVNNTLDGVLDYYRPDVITANDYYPFGMILPERNWNAVGAKDYRYGFNGKENDNETIGEGGAIDFGARIYNPRLGRWMSTDPVVKPYIAPYQFGANNPVNFLDPDGADEFHFKEITTVHVTETGRIEVRKTVQLEIVKKGGVDQFYWTKWNQVMSVCQPLPTQWMQPMPPAEATYSHMEQGETVQLFPFDRSCSAGVTTSSTGSIPNDIFIGRMPDRDFETLMQMMFNNKGLVDYVQERGSTNEVNDEGWDFMGNRYRLNGFVDRAMAITNLTVVLALTEGVMARMGTYGAGVTELTATEFKILADTKLIINSKEFDVIRSAHKNGISAQVTIGGRSIHYEPDFTFGEAMTLHGQGGFLLGPKAFASQQNLNQTVLWELTRLHTQNIGGLTVEQTAIFSQSAQQTSQKLLPLLK